MVIWGFQLPLLLILAHRFLFCDCYEEPGKNRYRREASAAQMPYIVYMEMDSLYHADKPHYHAAGTIIDVNIILTLAYHCEIARSSSMRIYPGQTYARPEYHEYRVYEYRMHPGRKRGTADETGKVKHYRYSLKSNFCLLRLRESLEFGPYVQKAPLPLSRDKVLHKVPLWSFGWGPYRNRSFVQGQMARGDFEKAALFYQETELANENECINGINAKIRELVEDAICVEYMTTYTPARPAYGDDGAPVVDVRSGLVVALVATLEEGYARYVAWGAEVAHRIAWFEPCVQLKDAVDWINEMRRHWVPMAPPLR